MKCGVRRRTEATLKGLNGILQHVSALTLRAQHDSTIPHSLNVEDETLSPTVVS